jgi:hypothetical protein
MFESVRSVEATDPAVLASALFTLTDDEIEGMSQAQAEALTVAAQRVVSAATARQRSAMETVARRCDEQAERDVADGMAVGMRRRHVSGHAVAAGSLAALLHVSPRTMSTRISHARRVVCSLPQVQALAWSGDLEPYRVDAVVTESLAAPTDRLHEFEARVLEGDATQLSCAALRRRARRSAERCNPQEAAQAAELARGQRDVSIRPGECSGMTRLVADLPTPTALRLWSAVDGLAAEYARAQPGLRMGAARADALSDLVEANATISTTIELVAPIDCERPGTVAPPVSTACLGVRDDAADSTDLNATGTPSPGTDTADRACDGHGSALPDSQDSDTADRASDGDDSAIPDSMGADAAAELTAVPGWYADLGGCEELDDGVLHDHEDQVWFVSSHTEVPVLGSLLPADVVALLSDPDVVLRLAGSDSVTGAVRWQDPTTYRPGAAMARAVRSRDGTCRFPGCATAAKRCQLDHVIRHPDGPTSVPNLQSLCATHHGFKHHAGWRVEMDPLGVCTWTAPDGRTHTTWPLDRHGFRAA